MRPLPVAKFFLPAGYGIYKSWGSVKNLAGILLGAGALAFLVCAGSGCRKVPEDEARLAGLSPNDFPQITADIFQPMDGGIALAPNEIMGRNT